MTPDFIKDVVIPTPLALDISEQPKGINNYHIDINLSTKFKADLKKLVAVLVLIESSMNAVRSNKEKESIFISIRSSYHDMMTVLIHRLKTDLKEVEVNFIQFAIPKYVLQSVTNGLNETINKAKIKSSELRSHGSGEVLKVHQQLAWITRNYNSILYRINSQIFEQLRRVESRQLQQLRSQYIQPGLLFADFLANPLLLNRDLDAAQFLIEHYVYWGGSIEENEFPSLNQQIEELLQSRLPELETVSLKLQDHEPPTPSEIYDELGGLHAVQPYMGLAMDSKNILTEDFCWLDYSGNIENLFDIEQLVENSKIVRKEEGFRAAWAYKKQLKHLSNILRDVGKILRRKKLLLSFIASYKIKKIGEMKTFNDLDVKLLWQYLCGSATLKKLEDPTLGGRKLSQEERETLLKIDKEIALALSPKNHQVIRDIMIDLARFRLHLKQFRFAHRIFNRIKILEQPNELQLSKQAHTLYQLPTSAEVESDDEKIIHHTIMKADVRGSTTVTDQLEKMGLNPASHFSLHFFNPINKILPVFGAGKVFIEGDAVILSFLEYEQTPQQWFSVARACGLARSMLQIIDANNKHARQVGLPVLELGIGICFSAEAPRFLFDGDQPIMISSAIGLADRMSSCSWKLRAQMKPGLFNVEVLEIAEGDRDRGEKGQQLIRYNVNGILLENEAFAKLQKEITLLRVTAKLDGVPVILHTGDYLDMEGNRKFLVIREGRIGLWQNDSMVAGEENREPYYEVVTNGKVISLLQAKL